MTQTVTALFDTYDEGARAVRELEAAGVPHGDISIVANDPHRDRAGLNEYRGDKVAEDAAKGAGLGSAVGGVGGLLAGIGLLAIPGLGPVVAAGWLASTVVGAMVGGAVGGATGGLVGALTGAGVPERDAHAYAEGVRRGGTLVTARVNDDQATAARAILSGSNSIDIASRRTAYQGEGWTGFDQGAAPYSSEQVLAERQRYVR